MHTGEQEQKAVGQATDIPAQIEKNIRGIGYCFLGILAVAALEVLPPLLLKIHIMPFPFEVAVLLPGLPFVNFLFRLNSLKCPNCGEKPGRLYGFIPFKALHDFDMEKCKHCHHYWK
jgi:hypothetical protein